MTAKARNPRRLTKRQGYLGLGLLLSLFIHLLVSSSLTLREWLRYLHQRDADKNLPTTPPVSAAPHAITTRMLSAKDLAKMPALQQQLRRQIVQTQFDKIPKTKPKDSAEYLAEHTQRVERETVAAGSGSVTGGGSAAQADKQTGRQATRAQDAQASRLERLGMSSAINSRVATRLETSPRAQSQREQSDTSSTGADQVKTGIVKYGNLDPHDRPIAIGTQTLLNTDEYLNAGFFNRVKEQIFAHWSPLIQRAYRANEGRLRPNEYLSAVRIFMDPATGDIKDVVLSHASGEKLFDEAAVTSSRMVLRFENPPKDLIGPDGRASFEMNFTMTIGQGGPVQFQAMPMMDDPGYGG